MYVSDLLLLAAGSRVVTG